jgi:hypothetical protein
VRCRAEGMWYISARLRCIQHKRYEHWKRRRCLDVYPSSYNLYACTQFILGNKATRQPAMQATLRCRAAAQLRRQCCQTRTGHLHRPSDARHIHSTARNLATTHHLHHTTLSGNRQVSKILDSGCSRNCSATILDQHHRKKLERRLELRCCRHVACLLQTLVSSQEAVLQVK